jgi:uncharacterized membrane protein YhaH (DUF805 family)
MEMTRFPYWITFTALIVVGVAANHTYDENISFMVSMLVLVGMPTIAAMRAKDAGRRPWVWALLSFVPLCSIIVGCFPSPGQKLQPRLA